ncbi:MmcQ/YjbR family DNA-binding protein [Jiangella asiatica]|uniref:MmcQ/YjbR family DNA-binding protein n=1 Tax=Jiangella asiatica TaxID=2530372 RepID=A0A4R5DGF5_9ACTN|nr:MmcQ/YjbR family DNA-binding protein [Jiangella asiatica]TDE13102.1 MmcQ/YjbR family DNA-binding protein [Jiangella asiatica]
MAVPDTVFLGILDRLPEVRRRESPTYTSFTVRDKTFGYLWEATQTVGLKQTIPEQLALVAERPHVFEIQFTAGAFGWVVVHLSDIEADELTELTFEAWRLTAPSALIDEFGDQPPR